MAGNRACCSAGRTTSRNEGVQLVDSTPSPGSSLLYGHMPTSAAALRADTSVSGLRRLAAESDTYSQTPRNKYFVGFFLRALDENMKTDETRELKAVVLTHDHDVGVGQEGPVSVGGLALIDRAVRRFGVV